MRIAEQLVNLQPLRRERPPVIFVPKFVPTSSYVGVDSARASNSMRSAAERKLHQLKKTLDNTGTLDVESLQSSPMTGTLNNSILRSHTMNLTLKGISKDGKKAVYQGAAVLIPVSIAAFSNRTAPQSFDVADGVFEGPKAPKAKLTPEERKAARASKPALTLAEKIAKREEQIAKMKAKLDAQSTADAQTM